MYLNCAGSLIPNIIAPDDSGPDAAYGTVAHSVTEQWLRSGKAPRHLIGTNVIVETDKDWHLVDIDEEMFGYAQECVDRCEWEPGDHLVEEHVDFSHLTPIPNQGGTLDFAAMRPRVAVVVDHKFGSSPDNIVMAEENTQAMLYAIGLLARYDWKYDFREFVIRINQPRLKHFDEWICSRARLLEFAEYAKERMAAAWRINAPRTPGVKQCRFCKVRATCAANAALQVQLLDGVFGDTTVQTAEDMNQFVNRLNDDVALNLVPVGDLTTEQMARLLPFRSMAEAWWAALEDTLNRRALERGEKVPGFKLVEARTHRTFPNKKQAEQHLISAGLSRNKIISESLCTPAEAERQLKSLGRYKPSEIESLLKPVIFKPSGRKVLAPLNDRRNEARDVADEVFTDTSNQP